MTHSSESVQPADRRLARTPGGTPGRPSSAPLRSFPPHGSTRFSLLSIAPTSGNPTVLATAAPELPGRNSYQGSLARRELLSEAGSAAQPPTATSDRGDASSNVGGGALHRRLHANRVPTATPEQEAAGESDRLLPPTALLTAATLTTAAPEGSARAAGLGAAGLAPSPYRSGELPAGSVAGPSLAAAAEIPAPELRSGNADRADSFRAGWIDCPRKFRRQLDFYRLFESIDFTSRGIGVQGTALSNCAAAVLTNADSDSALTPEVSGTAAAKDVPPSGRG